MGRRKKIHLVMFQYTFGFFPSAGYFFPAADYFFPAADYFFPTFFSGYFPGPFWGLARSSFPFFSGSRLLFSGVFFQAWAGPGLFLRLACLGRAAQTSPGSGRAGRAKLWAGRPSTADSMAAAAAAGSAVLDELADIRAKPPCGNELGI